MCCRSSELKNVAVASCAGDAQLWDITDPANPTSANGEPHTSEHGIHYFDKMVNPGDPAPQLESRYIIPRAQSIEVCVSHNANVVPVNGRYLMVAAYCQGGNSIVDFTDVANPTEVAYSDLEDAVGAADSWSTYWYNDRVYANGGLNRRPQTNRGLDIFNVILRGRLKAKRFAYMNPQTQEAFQQP
jgi:hypothetical protein